LLYYVSISAKTEIRASVFAEMLTHATDERSVLAEIRVSVFL
jgi:hypothetical protein